MRLRWRSTSAPSTSSTGPTRPCLFRSAVVGAADRLLAIILVIAVGTVIGFLSTLDPNTYRSDIERALKDATGREVSLGGDLTFPVSLAPTVTAQSVTIAKASWRTTPVMVISALVALATGFSVAMPFWLAIQADSVAITAGAVGMAP